MNHAQCNFFILVAIFGLSCACDSGVVLDEIEIEPSALMEMTIRDCNGLGYSLTRIVDVQAYEESIFVLDRELGDVFWIDANGCIVNGFENASKLDSIGRIHTFHVGSSKIALYYPFVKRVIVYDINLNDHIYSNEQVLYHDFKCYLRDLFIHDNYLLISCPIMNENAIIERDIIDTTYIKFHLPTIKFERRWIRGGEVVATMVHNDVSFFYRDEKVHLVYKNVRDSVKSLVDLQNNGSFHRNIYDLIDSEVESMVRETNMRILNDGNENAYQFVRYVLNIDSRESVTVVLWNAIQKATILFGEREFLLSFKKLQQFDSQTMITDIAVSRFGLVMLDRFSNRLYLLPHEKLVAIYEELDTD